MYKLKLGLDATPLSRLSGGIGFYIFYHLDELIRQRTDVLFILYTSSNQGDITHFNQYSNVHVKKLPFLSFCHSLWNQTTLLFAVWKDDLDYFWGSTQSLPLITPKKLKTLLTVYDFVFLFYPETVARVKCFYMKIFSKFMFKKANYIIPISEGTAHHLRSLYSIIPSSIVHPPIKQQIRNRPQEECLPILKRHKLEYKRYVITVGSLEPRKNFIELLTFYESLMNTQDSSAILPLVIVGSGGWRNSNILKKLKTLSNSYPQNIIALGFISDLELSHYLSGASFTLLFSLYEGYGMPLAESRTCKTPVVCFDTPEMREAAANDGIFLDRNNYKEYLSKLFTSKDQKESLTTPCPSYENNSNLAKKISNFVS